MINRIVDIVFVSIIVILAILLQKSCNKNSDSSAFLSAYQDTLVKERNKLGQEVSQRSVLVGNIDDLQKLVSGKDSILKELQKIVNKRTMNATVVSSVTSNTVSGRTVIVKTDTIHHHDTLTLYPTYYSNFNNKWEKFDITSNKDSVHMEYKLFNEYDITTEWKSDGLFKPKRAVIGIVNLNPHTETIDMRSFSVRQPKQYRWAYLVSGVLVGFVAHTVIK